MNSEKRQHRQKRSDFLGTSFLRRGHDSACCSRLGISDFGWTIRHYWPVIVIVIGASKLVHRRTIWAGLWLISVGVWLQMVTLHIYGFTYGSSWPLLLVILGGGMM